MKLINKRLIKQNFYSTFYFLKTKEILDENHITQKSIIQWKSFNKGWYIMAGFEEIILILKTALSKKKFKSLIIKYAPDGTKIQEGQCVLSIEGQYRYICILENLIDGILARRCSVATNCYKILQLINVDQLVFMSDRSDDYRLHPFDGYAAYIGGVRQFSNDSHIALIKDPDVKVFGSMPHALIQQFQGDITKAFSAYWAVESSNATVLVDFDNDIIKTLSELKPFFHMIQAIRIDTSNNMIDASLQKLKKPLYGVNHQLVCLIRKYLDHNDAKHIKIIATSNNNLETLTNFKKLKTPIDGYGIGSYLTQLNLHFTADVVMFDNRKIAKKGRSLLDTSHLKIYQTNNL